MHSNIIAKREKSLNSLRKKRQILRRTIFLRDPSMMEMTVRLSSNNICVTMYSVVGNPIFSILASTVKTEGNRRSKKVAIILAQKIFEKYTLIHKAQSKAESVNKDSKSSLIPYLNCQRYHGIVRVLYENFCNCFSK